MNKQNSISGNNNQYIYQLDSLNSHYQLFCNNLNESLLKELNVNINSPNNKLNDWIPPKTYGLCNFERLNPQHYLDHNNPLKPIDMFYEITKDIRNLVPLNEVQLNYIKTLSKEKILELLQLYAECFKTINELLIRL